MAVEGLSNEVFVYNNTLVNLKRGLAERVFNVEVGGTFQRPPQARDGVFNNLNYFRDAVLKRVGPTTRVSYEVFVSMYSGRKHTIYDNAVKSLLVRPLRKADSYLSIFVKAEKVVPTPTKPWPAPRVIQPRSPRYNVEVGRFLKALEKPICKAIDRVWGEPTIMKGYTVEGVATCLHEKWLRYRKPVAVGLDASRFDQHVGCSALKHEHSLYKRCFKGSDRADLKRLLNMQLRNKGWGRCSDGVIKYTVHGCRMSGDMNTSLGNCYLMCAMVHCYAKTRGVNCSLANNGDDCVLIMEERDLNVFLTGLEEFFRGYGFTMKVEAPVYEFEHIEFCQMRPVHCVDGPVMVRDVLKSLMKDLTTILSIPTIRQAQQWFWAIGSGGASLTYGVPVLHSLYTTMRKQGIVSNVGESPWLADTGFMRLESQRVPVPISASARYSFWRAFNITPDAQVELERIVPKCQWAPGVSAQAGITYNILCNGKS